MQIHEIVEPYAEVIRVTNPKATRNLYYLTLFLQALILGLAFLEAVISCLFLLTYTQQIVVATASNWNSNVSFRNWRPVCVAVVTLGLSGILLGFEAEVPFPLVFQNAIFFVFTVAMYLPCISERGAVLVRELSCGGSDRATSTCSVKGFTSV